LRFGRAGDVSDLTDGLDFTCVCQFLTGHQPGDDFTIIFRRGSAPLTTGNGIESDPFRAVPYLLKRLNPETIVRTEKAGRVAAFPHEILGGRIPARIVLHEGSGIFSRLAWAAEEGRLEVTAVDPLAELYTNLIERCRYEYPVRAVPGSSDRAAAQFGSRAFDAACVDCGLDDAPDFENGLKGIHDALKPGGRLVLGGIVEERTFHGWVGGPYRDISFDDGAALLRSPDGPARPIGPMSPLRVIETRVSANRPGERFTLVLERPD
jgi:SAM-dependent methyltransferase